jgi:hypothetical protein
MTSSFIFNGVTYTKLVPADGWIPVADTWTYASATTINVPTNATLTYQKGWGIRWKQGGAYKYAYLTTVAATLLTIAAGSDYSVANAAITDVAYCPNPTAALGFPDWFNFTIGYTGFSSNPTTLVSKFKITGQSIRIFYVQNALGTSNANTFTLTGLPVAAASNFTLLPIVCFGANNSANIGDPTTSYLNPLRVDIAGTTVTLGNSHSSLSAWTASGTKGVYSMDFSYLY